MLKRIAVLFIALIMVVLSLALTASAGGDDYSIDFKGADLKSYPSYTPGSVICPTGGRSSDPLPGAQHASGVKSLAPIKMGLGQVVAFEFEIDADTDAPADGSIVFTAGWSTKTTSGALFGYDESYGVLCAFVDSADSSEGDVDAAVTQVDWVYADYEITGAFTVVGIDPGEAVVVEVWVVLDDEGSLTPSTTGNVHAALINAQTSDGEKISTGTQTVPLLRVGDFLKVPADVSVAKSDPGTGTQIGHQFDYTVVVQNNSADVMAQSVVVTDTLDPDTAFVALAVSDPVAPVTDADTMCSVSDGVVACDLVFLNPGEAVTLTITVEVLGTASTDGTVEDGTCDGADLCNMVEVASLNDDELANNTDTEPTDVIVPTVDIHPAIEVVKVASVDTVDQGDPVEWTITVTNRGDTTLFSVTVNDSNGATFGSATFKLTADDGDDNGGTDQASWTYTTFPSQDVTNIATASGVDVRGQEVTDQDQARVEVLSPDDDDNDGLPDYLDADDDGDGIPTVEECPVDAPCADSDGDGIPDYLDPDDDGDGINTVDECPTGPPCADSDGDGTPDYLDPDDDGDGINTADECPAGPPCADSDGDGTPDYLDPDDDGDGINTADECPAGPPCADSDGDGTPDYLDPDDDGDGIPTAVECPAGPPCQDSDEDGTPDYLDPDSDGDGISDADEWSEGGDDPLAGCSADDPTCFDNDADGDGIPNYLDPDSDGDGLPDAEEGTGDSDGDGIPDWLDPDLPGPAPAPEEFVIFLPMVSNGR